VLTGATITQYRDGYQTFKGGRPVADDVCKRILTLTSSHLVEVGRDASRRPKAEPRASPSAHLEEKLLKQPAHFERRAIAAVRHHGRRDVALAIDLPADNGGAARSASPLGPRSPFSPAAPRLPWLTISCQPGPGQGPGASLSSMQLPPTARQSHLLHATSMVSRFSSASR
jgi:hypothetical protein